MSNSSHFLSGWNRLPQEKHFRGPATSVFLSTNTSGLVSILSSSSGKEKDGIFLPGPLLGSSVTECVVSFGATGVAVLEDNTTFSGRSVLVNAGEILKWSFCCLGCLDTKGSGLTGFSKGGRSSTKFSWWSGINSPALQKSEWQRQARMVAELSSVMSCNRQVVCGPGHLQGARVPGAR